MTKQKYPTDGMVPVDAGVILHIFRWLKQRPQLYKCGGWPQLFFKAEGAPLGHAAAYEAIEWEDALEWAEER